MDAVYGAVAFIGLKASTIITAAIMAGLGFLLDSRRHSWPTAILAIFAGMAVAVLMTDPLSDYLHVADSWHNAIAGVLGIAGRNLVVVVLRVSRDPSYLIKLWRGQSEEDSNDGPDRH